MSNPLFLQDHKELSLQVTDIDTLIYLLLNTSVVPIFIRGNEYIFANLVSNVKKFLPKEEYFTNPEHVISIHGITHLVRVCCYGYLLQNLFNILPVDQVNNYLYACAWHDVARVDDRDDIGHGERSGLLFGSLMQKSNGIDDSQVLTMCKYHETPIDKIPRDEYTANLNIISAIKASDALDRFRLHKLKWWPKEEYLQIKQAITLFDFAKSFTLLHELIINIDDSNSTRTAKSINALKKIIEYSKYV